VGQMASPPAPSAVPGTKEGAGTQAGGAAELTTSTWTRSLMLDNKYIGFRVSRTRGRKNYEWRTGVAGARLVMSAQRCHGRKG
jgi:hypothetical protein